MPLPSTSPKNKCFGEAPLPCGAGRRFLLPTVAGILCERGDFAAIKKGGKKVSYPSYNLSAKKSPLLYIRSILAELKNQYKYNEFNCNWGEYSTVMIYKLNGRIIPTFTSYDYFYFSSRVEKSILPSLLGPPDTFFHPRLFVYKNCVVSCSLNNFFFYSITVSLQPFSKRSPFFRKTNFCYHFISFFLI